MNFSVLREIHIFTKVFGRVFIIPPYLFRLLAGSFSGCHD